MSQQQPDPVAVALAMTEAVNGLSERLDQVKTDSEARDDAETKARKRNDRRGYAFVAIDVILTIALAVLSVIVVRISGDADRANARADSASAAASALHAAQISGCQAGNESRRQQLAIWDYLLAETKAETPKQAAQLAAFRHLLDTTFAPRDCARVYSLNPTGGAK